MAAVLIGGPATAEQNGSHARVPPRAATQGASLSKADYVRLLIAEIRRQKPGRATTRFGTAEVVFTIGAAGRVVDYELTSVENRKQVEPLVQRILYGIRMPPPPGGSFEAKQRFQFSYRE